MNSPYTRSPRTIKHAFVTGATGLLGNNLVRALLKQGIKVTALVRSMEKARLQFGDLPIQYVKGDILNPEAFRSAFTDCDTLFHTAAFFAIVTKAENIGKNSTILMLQEPLIY